jgi:hypothetical protein
MNTRRILIALMATGLFVAGCGDDSKPTAAKPRPVDLEERRAALEKDPHGVRCSDIRDERSTRNTRMVQHALAADVHIPSMSELAVSQSIYYALTEVCKSKPGSYEPAQEAIAGVKSGRWRAEF